jgi:hypothetical protein
VTIHFGNGFADIDFNLTSVLLVPYRVLPQLGQSNLLGTAISACVT